MLQTSSALAFTTLLALVPLVTLVLAVADLVPYLNLLLPRLDVLFREAMLPAGTSNTVLKLVTRFVGNARQLTAVGIATLAITTFMLVQTIERTFNHLWLVKPRPWWSRIRLYALLMTVWPCLLGAVAAAMTFAISASLGLLGDSMWLRRVAIKGVALLLLGGFFAFLYYALPNARVSRRAALIGGGFAALAFVLMQKVFELYFVASATLKSIYGAFAAFPVFLIWLHLSWAVVLLGGLIAAAIESPRR